MRRPALLIVLAISVVAATISLVVALRFLPIVLMAEMMGDRMVEQHSAFREHFQVMLAAFFVSVVASVATAAYYLAFPEIRIKPEVTAKSPTAIGYLDLVERFLRDDERQVVGILREAGGELEQREIAKRTGFSKIKTHRVVARLSERGIVLVTKRGRTNTIALAFT